MRDVLFRTGRIHDQQVMIAPVGEHQVIQDPARIVGEQAVTLPPGRQARDICGYQRLQRGGGGGHVAIIRGDQHLSHVADVEQPGPRAGVQMFGHHPHRVLHGHVPARKGHHAGTLFDMKVVETGPAARLGHLASCVSAGQPASVGRGMPPCVDAPSVRAGAPVGTWAPEIVIPSAGLSATLQSSWGRRSFCLRVSGAVAPSAPAQRRCLPNSCPRC